MKSGQEPETRIRLQPHVSPGKGSTATNNTLTAIGYPRIRDRTCEMMHRVVFPLN
jgi:hypothetical protein